MGNHVATSTRDAVRPVLEHVSNIVRGHVAFIAESANLQSEMVFDSARNKRASRGSIVYENAKLMCEDEDKVKFKRIKESIRNVGFSTHFAVQQIIPDIIESQYECNKNQHGKQGDDDRINVNKCKQQQLKSEKKETPQQNKYHEVLIKAEKNGTCTWAKRSKNNAKSDPIRRRSVHDVNNNRRGLRCLHSPKDHKIKYKKSFGARGA